MTSATAPDRPHTVICRYEVRAGNEDKMLALLKAHWPALRAAELVTDEASRIYRAIDDAVGSGERTPTAGADPDAVQTTTFVEVFAWTSARAADVAHQTPSILAIWEPMAQLCQHMEFPHFERVDLGHS